MQDQIMSSSTISDFRVVGIAMVVDQLGKGPRMILRYPCSTNNTNNSSKGTKSNRTIGVTHRIDDIGNNKGRTSSNNNSGGNPSASTSTNKESVSNVIQQQQYHDDENMFHQLSGRQMAKLFRPKRSLAGQPITLTIDHTYFCCCAVLMESTTTNTTTTTTTHTSSSLSSSLNNQNECSITKSVTSTAVTETNKSNTNNTQADSTKTDDNTTSTTTNTTATTKDQPLVMFSVIVALAPNNTSTSSSIQQPTLGPTRTTMKSSSSSILEMSSNHTNPIFPSIRRVHISLARLCKILEREERRCKYVSCQIKLCELIRTQFTTTTTTTSTNNAKSTNTEPVKKITLPSDSTIIDKTIVQKDTISSNNINNNNTNTSTTTSSNNSISPTNNATTIPNTNQQQQQTTTTTTTTTNSHRRTGSFSFPSSLDGGNGPTVVPSTNTPQTSTNTATIEPPNAVTSSTTTTTTTQSEPDVLVYTEITFHEQELEQVILETIMTSPPTKTILYPSNVEIVHAGNLAQELVQVYHALARTNNNNYNYSNSTIHSTPDVLLSGEDRIVYINRHIAVTIEAVAPISTNLVIRGTPSQQHFNTTLYDQNSGNSIVRPYVTLLFPKVSPKQILESFERNNNSYNITGTIQPRRIQQFLRIWNPKKSLYEMAKEVYIPLPIILDIATQLVHEGLCIISPVLSYSSYFVCPIIQQIHTMTLPFYQQFGISSINLFVLISYLTESNRTFGMSISQLIRSNTMIGTNTFGNTGSTTMTNDPIVQELRDSIVKSIIPSSMAVTNQMDGNNIIIDNNNDLNSTNTNQMLEDSIYQMVVWLCSQQIIVPKQDYIILIHPNPKQYLQHNNKHHNNIASLSATTLSILNEKSNDNNNNNATTTNTATKNTSNLEERKYDETIIPTKATTIIPASNSTPNTNNDPIHPGIDDTTNNDFDIIHDRLFELFMYDDHQHRNNHDKNVNKPSSMDYEYQQKDHHQQQQRITIFECCYQIGIDERRIRNFVQYHEHLFRIIVSY